MRSAAPSRDGQHVEDHSTYAALHGFILDIRYIHLLQPFSDTNSRDLEGGGQDLKNDNCSGCLLHKNVIPFPNKEIKIEYNDFPEDSLKDHWSCCFNETNCLKNIYWRLQR